MSNHSRERAPRVVLAVALVATAAIVSLVSVITSFVLVPALVVSVVCAACGVGVVIAQMTEDRRRDAQARAHAASEFRDTAVATSQENMVFVRTMQDQLRAGRATIDRLSTDLEHERKRAAQAEVFARAHARRAESLAQRVGEAEEQIAQLQHTIREHAEVDWDTIDASWVGREHAPSTTTDVSPTN